MTLFWLLYGLAGLGFVVAWLDYFLPWATSMADASEIERTQLKTILETPALKASVGTLIFLIWPLLFIFILLFGLYILGLFLIELAVIGAVTAYTGVRWQWAKYKYRKEQMDQYREMERYARAGFKDNIESNIKEIMKTAKANNSHD